MSKEILGSLELNRIYQFDCVEGMKLLPNDCIDLTVTSPPYDDLRTYNGYSFEFEKVANELYRVTKDGGTVVWVVNDKTVKGSETLTSFKQAIHFKEIGFNVHDTMIWRKTNPPPQTKVGKRYTSAFEYMFIFTKGKINTYNPIMTECKTKGTEAGSKASQRRPDGHFREDRRMARQGSKVKDEKPLTNIWEIGVSKGYEGHPATFPEKIAQDHILSWSNEGDIVLDCFMGSGTTAKMAILNNRKWLGFEVAQEYIEIANKRLDSIQLKDDIKDYE